jgi:DHA1 family multidrug resistance protein-like MFS transporter
LVGLCIEYVSSAVVGPSFRAYVAEQSDEEQRGQVFGITEGIFSVVGVIGPALGGFLAYRLSFRWMMVGAFALYFLATLVRLWMARAERFAPERSSQELSWTGLKTELVAMFSLLVAGGLLTWIWVTDAIGDTAFNLIGQLYPIYLADIGGLNLEQIGLLNALRGGANIVSAFVSGWLIDRRSEREIVIAGFVLEAAGIAIVLQAKDIAGYLLAMVIFGLGTGSLAPAYNSLISKAVPEEKRGIAYGLFGTSLSLLALPFPWIGAQLWEGLGPQVPFWIVVGACLISIPIAWFTFVLPQANETEAAATTDA